MRLTDQQNVLLDLLNKAAELEGDVNDIEEDVIKEEAL